MLFYVSNTFHVGGDSDLDAVTDLVMDALLSMEVEGQNLNDSDVAAELTNRRVTISFVVEAEDMDSVTSVANEVLERAIEAGNGVRQDEDPLTMGVLELQKRSTELVPEFA